MDPIERNENATAVAAGKIESIAPNDLTKPTPCADLDVRALLNHVIGGE